MFVDLSAFSTALLRCWGHSSYSYPCLGSTSTVALLVALARGALQDVLVVVLFLWLLLLLAVAAAAARARRVDIGAVNSVSDSFSGAGPRC